MLFAVLSGFLVALFAPPLCRLLRQWSGWFFALLPLALIVYFAGFIARISSGESIFFSYRWLPALGINLSFNLDGLSLLFVLLITSIGALVFIYSGSYLGRNPELGRFFAYILMFMGSMLGVVLADNAIVLFVFWELTSLSSYFLIGFDHDRAAAREAALQALLVTGLGGLALLAGFLLMGQVGGTLEISRLYAEADPIRSHELYLPILLLILAGAFTKSAQTPFHFWLPNAMEAPAPVSTYLHSATMVKAGIYLLARVSPILAGTPMWEYLITPVGTLTMLVGAYLALVHTDMKRILAYTTVSALGLMVMMLGIEASLSTQAAMVFLLAHAFYKGALFLVAGAVDHETGTRDVEKLGGLFRTMPFVAIAAMLAALSSAGVPPHLGFVGKELIYKVAFGEGGSEFMLGAVFLTNISFVTIAGIVGFRPFVGRRREFPRIPHKPPLALWLGPFVLAALGLVIGAEPGLIENWLIAPATAVIESRPVEYELKLWHGFHSSLLLSVLAFIIGIVLFFGWHKFRKAASYLIPSEKWGPARWYSLLLEGLAATARGSTRMVQSGHLHIYLLIIVCTTIGLVATSLFNQKWSLELWRWSNAYAYELVLAGVIVAATVAVVKAKSLIAAVLSLGVVGYGVALVFLLFSAPDLAMTQFAIESLSVVLLALVLFRLPEIEHYSKTRERVRDALAALALGGVMTVLVLSVTAMQKEARLVSYFAEHSYLDAKGHNIVNVILVDFRGFDTMGEITVLAVAAIGVYSLLKLYLKRNGRQGGNQ